MNFDIKIFENNLINSIKNSKNIIIVPHVYPDFDAIGSAIGIAQICNSFGLKSYILINDLLEKLDFKVKEIIMEAKDKFNIINLKDYEEIKSDKDLLITTDVNKVNMIPLEEKLKDFKEIYIVDHHNLDINTIKTDSNHMFIDSCSSSASEIVTNMILDLGVKIDCNIATYLYSGIVLDTDRFTKNTSSNTFVKAAELIKRGADIERASYFLKSNSIQNLKIYKLVNSAKFLSSKEGIVGIAKDDTQMYDVKEIAIAANKILDCDMAISDEYKSLNFENLRTSIAMGPVNKNSYHISARSQINGLNVCNLMKELGGGGSSFTIAAAEIDKKEVSKNLLKICKFIKGQ